MLHLGHDDFVALLHLTLAERAGHQVDSLSSAAGKDDLFYLAGVDETTYFLAGGLMQIGGLLTEVVNATMHVGIHIEILVPHGIEHHEWFLSGSRVVKINQRLLVNLARQDREIFPDFIDIVHIFIYRVCNLCIC